MKTGNKKLIAWKKKRLDKLKFLWHRRLQQREIKIVILKNEKIYTVGICQEVN